MAYDQIRTRSPEPPRDVQFIYPDGTQVPVDCLYVGWDAGRSLHVWQAMNPRGELPTRTLIAYLPNRCVVEIAAGPDRHGV